MAGKRIGKFVAVLIDDTGASARTITNEVIAINGLPITRGEIEVGGYGQDMNYLLGRGDSSITLTMLFTDTATTGTHTIFSAHAAAPNTGGTVDIRIGANAAPTTGDPKFTGEFVFNNYTVIPDLNGSVTSTVVCRPKEGQALPAWGTV